MISSYSYLETAATNARIFILHECTNKRFIIFAAYFFLFVHSKFFFVHLPAGEAGSWLHFFYDALEAAFFPYFKT